MRRHSARKVLGLVVLQFAAAALLLSSDAMSDEGRIVAKDAGRLVTIVAASPITPSQVIPESDFAMAVGDQSAGN